MSEFDTHSTLIERVRDANDLASWREFVELYEPLLMGFVLKRGTPHQESQDIVQEVFTKLLRTLPSFEFDRSQGKFRTWLWSVSRNVMVDWARSSQRRVKAEEEWCIRLANLRDDPDSRAEWRADHKKRVLESILTKVRADAQPKTWACFEEHLQKGRRAADVGKELELTANAVYVNASRVLQRVRNLAAEFGEALDDD